MATPAVVADSRAARPQRLLFRVPHRFFFLAGVATLAPASLWWTWVILSRAWPALPPPASAVPDTVLHALVMTCGFAPFFMFGFLFTAGPRWLGMPPLPSAAWLPGGLIAVSGALLLVPLQAAGAAPLALRVAAGIYAVGWLLLLDRFFRLIRASPVPDKVHATIVLVALAVGASSPLAFALLGARAHGW